MRFGLKIPKFNAISQKELGYLIGIIDGDGYLTTHTYHYRVQIFLNSLKDCDVQNYLLTILKRMNLNARVVKDKRFNCFKIEVTSKLFYGFIKKLSSNHPRNKNFKLGYISGIIDSDGYVNPMKSYTQITNTNKRIIKDVQNYLKILNINSKITKKSKCIKDKLQRYSLYVPMKFIQTENNSMKIRRF